MLAPCPPSAPPPAASAVHDCRSVNYLCAVFCLLGKFNSLLVMHFSADLVHFTIHQFPLPARPACICYVYRCLLWVWQTAYPMHSKYLAMSAGIYYYSFLFKSQLWMILWLSELLSACLSGCLSVWLPVCLPLCPPACLSLSDMSSPAQLKFTNFNNKSAENYYVLSELGWSSPPAPCSAKQS